MSMKRVKSIVLAAILALVLLVGAGCLWIDRLAKIGIETGATYALGVVTTLGGMDIGMLSGNAAMTELQVENPDGFDTPHFLQLGQGRIAVSLGSLMEERVVVPELILTKISLNLQRKRGKANYQVILDGLKKFESQEKTPTPQESEGKKFVIQHVALEGIDVQVDLLPVGGALTRVPLKIERIDLRNVGSQNPNGIELAELTGILLKAILTSVANKGGSLLPKDITRELTSGLAGLKGLGGTTVEIVGDVTTIVDGQVRAVGELGKELLGGVGEGGKKLGEGLGDVGNKLEKGLGGLLPKSKKDKKKP